MKNLVETIKETQDNIIRFESWVHYLKIDMASETIKYLGAKDVHEPEVKKLVAGDSVMIDDYIYVCIY